MEVYQPPSYEGLVYGVEDKPPFFVSLLAAAQHLLAMILSVLMPPAIVCAGLKLPLDITAYLLSMSLLFAGIGIWFQVRRPFGIGSGMLSIQATSFCFPATLIAVGTTLMQERGLPWPDALATLFGLCFAGGLLVMLGGCCLRWLRRLITTSVAGVTVTMIGISLISVGAVDMAGGYAAKADGSFGDPVNLGLGGLVLLVIVLCNALRKPLWRMSAIVLGLLAGFLAAIPLGKVDWSVLDAGAELFVLPRVFPFGLFGFDWQGFAVIAFLFVLVIVEAFGDLTATSLVSGLSIRDKAYGQRVAGGIVCDGFITALGAVCGCFPVSTFSQNNGVIQLSGVASRKVGVFCAALFVLLAIFPVVVVGIQLLPRPVLGGALVALFGTIICSGVRILMQQHINRRETLIIGLSLGVGVMATVVPEMFAKLPVIMRHFFSSPIVCSGVTAVLIQVILPYDPAERRRTERRKFVP